MKSLLRSILHSLGFEITRRRPLTATLSYFRNIQMIQGLQRCKSIVPEISTIIDVGAAAGSWSLSAFELWRQSNYLLLEPLEERRVELESLVNKYSNFRFIPAAAGRESGEVSFYVADDLDGSGITEKISTDLNVRKVNVVSIDDEAKRLKLKGPYLIKLDTHGFEVPIIEGCKQVLSEVSVFIIECYGFQIADKSLLFWEMCQYMDQLGFRLFDIVDIMNRPKDGAFWQCDAFFMKKDNLVFNQNGYN